MSDAAATEPPVVGSGLLLSARSRVGVATGPKPIASNDPMIHVFTSSAPNYIGKVRVLCQSLREHCPDMMIHWLVADRKDDSILGELDDGSADELLFVDDLDGYHDPSWLFLHDIVELSTAIKPAAALQILDRDDCDLLIYFDPDQAVFSPLDDLIEALQAASVVLTPHLLEPEQEHKAVSDHELCALRNGVFNLGFFGVRDCDEGRAYLHWWRQRCLDFCWNDWRSGAFTDQKWVNFAPVFFPNCEILRNPRFNLAPWNINQRGLEGSFDANFYVQGEPLGFYHFTGFDSGAHRMVIDWYADGNGSVHMLADWYQARIEYLTPAVDLSWRLGRYDNGVRIATRHRRIYREREDLQSEFPDPYKTDESALCLQSWLRIHGPQEFPELLAEDRRGERQESA